MVKYKITHNRPECIGCSACVGVTGEFWKMGDDGKSDLVGGTKREDGWEEREIEEDQVEVNKEAAEACPVNVIHIKNLDTNEDII